MTTSFRLWYATIATAFIGLFIVQTHVETSEAWMPHLFGNKCNSTFDLWLICHFLFGVVLGGLCHHLNREEATHRLSTSRSLLQTITCLVLWELLEFPMELGYFGHAVAFWKDGVEHWSNRFVADPLMGLLGYACYRQFPKMFLPAVVIVVIFETVQISSPTCMTIQESLLP